jgi:hypothetical protein
MSDPICLDDNSRAGIFPVIPATVDPKGAGPTVQMRL